MSRLRARHVSGGAAMVVEHEMEKRPPGPWVGTGRGLPLLGGWLGGIMAMMGVVVVSIMVCI